MITTAWAVSKPAFADPQPFIGQLERHNSDAGDKEATFGWAAASLLPCGVVGARGSPRRTGRIGEMAFQQGLALYHYTGCGFCAYVRSAASDLGVELELLDIHAEPQHAADLQAATGRTTVPVLKITEPEGDVHLLAESADIVEYLRRLVG